MPLDYTLLTKKEEYPYELLLLADETKEAIAKYINDCDVYLVKKNDVIVGVFCLYSVDAQTVELKNIAVSELYQNQGIGSKIIAFIKNIAKKNFSRIIVGTADTGLNQIRFYERNGFKKFSIRKNFFIENYGLPIIENDIQLKDMILLKYDF